MIYIVIWDDRHADIDIIPFFFKKDAIAYAEKEAAEMLKGAEPGEGVPGELTGSMKEEGWLYFCCYSCEGDSIRVVEVTLN